MPTCEICGLESIEVYKCSKCDCNFCNECGDTKNKLCYDCIGFDSEEFQQEWYEDLDYIWDKEDLN
jgi:hypothetical protein